MILFTIFSNTFETAINYIQHATSKINIILQNISNSQISHTKKARQPTSLHVNCLSYVHLFFSFIICQIKRDKTFHLRNSKKLLMVFGNLVIF